MINLMVLGHTLILMEENILVSGKTINIMVKALILILMEINMLENLKISLPIITPKISFVRLEPYPKGLYSDRKYVGEFKDNKFNGQGVLSFPWGIEFDGAKYTKYVGNWVDGEKHGPGKYFVDSDPNNWKRVVYLEGSLHQPSNQFATNQNKEFIDDNNEVAKAKKITQEALRDILSKRRVGKSPDYGVVKNGDDYVIRFKMHNSKVGSESIISTQDIVRGQVYNASQQVEITQDQLRRLLFKYRVGKSPDYGVVKNGDDYLATFHSYSDDKVACESAIKAYGSQFKCIQLNK